MDITTGNSECNDTHNSTTLKTKKMSKMDPTKTKHTELLGGMVLGWSPFKTLSGKPTIHSRLQLLLKKEIL